MRKYSLKMTLALMLTLLSGAAAASGFQLVKQNGSGLGNAYAGSAAVGENASTIHHNPAAMTRLQARELSLGAVVAHPSLRFSDRGSRVDALAGTGNGGDAGDYWLALPNLHAAWAVNKDLYLGLGISAPFGLKSDYEKRWLGAAQSQLFDMKTLNVNPSVAWRASDKVSLGFGFNWQKVDMKSKALAGSDAAMSHILIRSKIDDDAWGWNAGALFELSPTTRLGLSYRSRIKYHMDGDNRLVSDGTATGGAVFASLPLMGISSQMKIKSDMTLPDLFILSVVQQLSSRWEMLGDISRTGWHVLPRLDVHEASSGARIQRLDADFRNTWRIAVGANYQYNEQWKLKYGVAYDQTPVKRAQTRLTQLPDGDRVWLTLGAQWAPDKATRFDFGLAYIDLRDSRIDRRLSDSNHLIGNYKSNIWSFGAQYSQSF